MIDPLILVFGETAFFGSMLHCVRVWIGLVNSPSRGFELLWHNSLFGGVRLCIIKWAQKCVKDMGIYTCLTISVTLINLGELHSAILGKWNFHSYYLQRKKERERREWFFQSHEFYLESEMSITVFRHEVNMIFFVIPHLSTSEYNDIISCFVKVSNIELKEFNHFSAAQFTFPSSENCLYWGR